jgi:hypothetical protein
MHHDHELLSHTAEWAEGMVLNRTHVSAQAQEESKGVKLNGTSRVQQDVVLNTTRVRYEEIRSV